MTIFPASWPLGDTRSTSSTSGARVKMPRSGGATGSTKSFARPSCASERESSWTVDDLVKYDVPAILEYVKRDTGRDRVNWIGHSLGGMLVFPYLELAPHPERIANFVGMGSTIIQAESPQTDMLRANQGLRLLSLVASPGRLGRPLAFVRIPGMELIDRFYYSNENVDRLTVSRFYGYTLEDTGPGASVSSPLISEYGHMLSADGKVDYSAMLGTSRHPYSWSRGTATSCRTSRPLS